MTIYFVSGLIILNAFACLFYTTCIGMIYDYITTIDVFYKYLNASFIFILVCDFTLNTMMLIIFIYKLQQLILSLDCDVDYNGIDYRNDDHQQAEDQQCNLQNKREQSIKLNVAQIKMITIMTRHTILSSIAILWNFLFYISVIYGSNFVEYNNTDLYFLGYSKIF